MVILAERDKEDMDRQLRRALRGSSVEWHTRSGAPHALADLEKVAAGQARTIILLQPDSAQVPRLAKGAFALTIINLAYKTCDRMDSLQHVHQRACSIYFGHTISRSAHAQLFA